MLIRKEGDLWGAHGPCGLRLFAPVIWGGARKPAQN